VDERERERKEDREIKTHINTKSEREGKEKNRVRFS
jgi:hypothetical protein